MNIEHMSIYLLYIRRQPRYIESKEDANLLMPGEKSCAASIGGSLETFVYVLHKHVTRYLI